MFPFGAALLADAPAQGFSDAGHVVEARTFKPKRCHDLALFGSDVFNLVSNPLHSTAGSIGMLYVGMDPLISEPHALSVPDIDVMLSGKLVDLLIADPIGNTRPDLQNEKVRLVAQHGVQCRLNARTRQPAHLLPGLKVRLAPISSGHLLFRNVQKLYRHAGQAHGHRCRQPVRTLHYHRPTPIAVRHGGNGEAELAVETLRLD
mmetsp:Transcript_17034/g.46202  ORF Transcript_17034/g.46202 Transcript_17034/m.46202 type:complete len:204 (-) Transcript_17034:278-889(-)